jgi:type II secretory pathway component PulF
MMATFRYKVRNRQGEAVTGVMEGDDERAVSQALSRQGYIPISIAPFEAAVSLMSGFPGRRLSVGELTIFTRQLWTMQKAGVPLLTSLTTLREQTKNRVFRDKIIRVIRDLESGASLSLAISRYPETFDSMYVNMVRAGEASGKLGEVLFHLAEMLEFETQTRGRIQSAMMYPMITFGTLIVAFIAVVVLVMPKFIGIYGEFHARLPLPTRILLGVNGMIRYHWVELVIGMAALVSLLRYYVSLPLGRFQWDMLKIKVPVFGPLFFNITMSRFAKILAELLAAGVPVLQALQLVSETVGNTVIQKAVIGIQKSVSEGRGMSEPMRQSGFFSPITIQMVAIGEQSGKTEELLQYVSGYYQDIASNMVKNLTALIEPFLIIIIGMCVLLLALGVFLPMWNLMNVVGK